MKRILFIDACVREKSRTRELAAFLLEGLSGETERVLLDDALIPSLDRERLKWRDKCCESGDFSDAYFDSAKQFAGADEIVIAAPFWDNSFPAVLKKYIESICVCGLTFAYTPEGMPRGLCRANRLHYVTTAGGEIFSDAYGYGYVRDLANIMFGIPETYKYTAEGLDIFGADPEKIMENEKKEISARLKMLL